ncbi:hypothetical protein Dimus_034913 [Dionaea muscipula]
MMNQELVFRTQVTEEDFSQKQHQIHGKPRDGYPEFKQRPIDLQLSADEFISQFNNSDFPVEESVTNPFEACNGFKSSLYIEKVSDVKDEKLSMGIRDGIIKKNGHRKKRCSIVPHDVINLEDPSFSLLLNDHARSTFSSGLAASSSRPGAKRNLTHGFTINSSSLADVGSTSYRQTSFFSDFHGQESEIRSTNFSTLKPRWMSRKALDLDLNLPEVDASLFSSDNSTVLNSVDHRFSLDTSLSPCSINSNSSYIFQNSSSQQIDGVTHGEKNCTEKSPAKATESGGANGSKLVIIDTDQSPSSPSLHCNEDLSSHEPAGSASKLSDGISCDAMQSGIDRGGDSHISIANELHKVSLGSSSVVEVDERVKMAAEAIVCISSSQPQVDDIDNLWADSDCSSDSYELLVLKQRESGPEDSDHHALLKPKPVEVSDSEKKVSVSPHYKLKRRTRMRDFQKDILPAMSSLLRYEICDDLSTIDNAIRSREYKEMRSKMGSNQGTRCTSTRSRRSRTNYRRKYYA